MGFFKHLKNGLADEALARDVDHEEGTEKDAPIALETLEAAAGDEEGPEPGVGNTPGRG